MEVDSSRGRVVMSSRGRDSTWKLRSLRLRQDLGGGYWKQEWVVWELQDYEYISLQGPSVDVGMQRPSFQRAFEEVKGKVDRETLVPLQLQTGLNMSIQGTGPGLKIPGKQTLWGLAVLQEWEVYEMVVTCGRDDGGSGRPSFSWIWMVTLLPTLYLSYQHTAMEGKEQILKYWENKCYSSCCRTHFESYSTDLPF